MSIGMSGYLLGLGCGLAKNPVGTDEVPKIQHVVYIFMTQRHYG